MGGLFAIMALIGAASVTIFPLGLELAMEVTRNAGSSAVLWFMSVPTLLSSFFRSSQWKCCAVLVGVWMSINVLTC